MKKRMFLMLGAVIVFLSAIGAIKTLQIRSAMAQQTYTPQPEAVTSVVASRAEWESTITAIGTVEAARGVVVAADLPGIVERVEFDSGSRVREGAVLVRLDASQELAQLEAAEARLELARLDLARLAELKDQRIVPLANYDRAAVEERQAVALVGEIRATIERKVIRAPFSGTLGIRRIDVGQYLNGGSPIVSLQSLDPVYVNFGVPQREIGNVREGAEVRVTADGVSDIAPGRVTAVDSLVDEATRNVWVQATFRNPDGRLQPGMFAEVQLVTGPRRDVIAVPSSAVNYAPFGDSLFVIEDMKGEDGATYRGVRQQFVKLGQARGDQVEILSGVKEGEEVVSSGVFKLRSGAAVRVDNTVQPSNEIAPEPEDN